MTIMEPTEVTIGEHTFYILKYPALKAANVLGKLNTVFSPLASGIVPLIGMIPSKDSSNKNSIFDMDISKALPIITNALTSLDGNTLQEVIELLVLKHNNVSVELTDNNGDTLPKKLNRDTLDDIFCGELQDLFFLAYKVIEINYKNFFGNLLTQFGARKKAGTQQNSKNTVVSTQLDLLTLS